MDIKREKDCKRVAYDSDNFDAEVLECLQTDRTFVLTHLPEELVKAIQDLYTTGDEFFDRIHQYNNGEFSGIFEPNKVRGCFKARDYKMRCSNGARFFIAVNQDGKVFNETIPQFDDKPDMANAAILFNRYTDEIIRKILAAIATKLNLRKEDLYEHIIGNSAIGVGRYYPITQNRIKQLFSEKKLVVHGDKVEQFHQHSDVNPITVLTYRDTPRGLYAKDTITKSYHPLAIDCDEPYLLIMTGKILKELTNGHIRALKHVVITSPEEQQKEAQNHPHRWRATVAKFTYCNKEELAPLNCLDGKPIQAPYVRKQQRTYPISQSQFFTHHLKSFDSITEKATTTTLSPDLLQKYPDSVAHADIYNAQLEL